ncbi:MAG: hypothetical protein WD623_05705 [Marinobacter sp.]|uniref:hypothetical protein n=1 Tax=Marinobacter sp. TaxID=50741 RepID=UPI0034A03E51
MSWGIYLLPHRESLVDGDEFHSHSTNEVAANRFAGNLLAPEQESSGDTHFRFKEPVRVFGKSYVGTVLEALYEQRITLATVLPTSERGCQWINMD